MAKHKQSTFERLRNGKLQWNRKERREVERRLNSTDPGLEIVNPHAAGIDVGNEATTWRCRQDAMRNRCESSDPGRQPWKRWRSG